MTLYELLERLEEVRDQCRPLDPDVVVADPHLGIETYVTGVTFAAEGRIELEAPLE